MQLAPAKHLIGVDAMLTGDARYRNARAQCLLDEASLEFQAVSLIARAPIDDSFDRLNICVHDLLRGHKSIAPRPAIMAALLRPVQTVLG
jgi:hypothetical protein